MTADVRRLRAGARREARSAWIGLLGRVGLAAQGFCFSIIGALAIGLVTGVGGADTDPEGAFDALARGGWTRALLALLVVGFSAYAIWRFAQALFDRGGMGARPEGLGRRGIQLCQGLIYLGLAVSAAHVLLGARPKPGAQRRATAGVLGWPAGRELVGFAATTLVVIAAVTLYWALSRRFQESLATEQIGSRMQRTVTVVGIAGLSSLAVVLAIVGWFLFKAAIEFDPRAAIGLGGALAKIQHATYGSYLLSIVATGFVIFGLFDFLQARFHKV